MQLRRNQLDHRRAFCLNFLLDGGTATKIQIDRLNNLSHSCHVVSHDLVKLCHMRLMLLSNLGDSPK